MKFGLFEHMDDSDVPLGRQFENRLTLIEACDRYGFYAGTVNLTHQGLAEA